MTVLSTLRDEVCGRTWSFPYNCYEIGHGWTPYCTGAAFDVGVAAFKNSLPLYTSLYLFTQLGLQRKYSPEAFYETFKSITTSSSFLGFNFFAGIGVSCLLRNGSDRYYYRLQCLFPGFIASYLALLIERPSRRPALAFYLANMSSELLYKWAESHGYIRSLPHGETILFALGMACWLRFVRIHGFSHDPVSVALKYLIGPLEAKSRAKSAKAMCSGEQREMMMIEGKDGGSKEAQQGDSGALIQKAKKRSKLTILGENWTALLNVFFGSHPVCPHKGISCVDYSLTPMMTRFTIAYLARSVLNLAPRYKLLMKDPASALRQAFAAQSSMNTGLFLASFVGLSKSMHCLLRRISNKQETWHSALAGGVAGLSMLNAPKSTLSTYIIWKCFEQYFFRAVDEGKIKNPNQIICLVYAISVNVLLYIFALEPKFIRPSYMKFIDEISNHKLHQVNRLGKFYNLMLYSQKSITVWTNRDSIVLDVFGTGASVGYEDFFPDLDPKFMTREFQELVFNWLIQPH